MFLLMDIIPSDSAIVSLMWRIPPLTEERRREYVKQAKQIAEDTKVALRKVRQEANDNIKKDEAVTEDDEKRMLEEVQQLINDYNKKVDEKYKEKEEELMKV